MCQNSYIFNNFWMTYLVFLNCFKLFLLHLNCYFSLFVLFCLENFHLFLEVVVIILLQIDQFTFQLIKWKWKTKKKSVICIAVRHFKPNSPECDFFLPFLFLNPLFSFDSFCQLLSFLFPSSLLTFLVFLPLLFEDAPFFSQNMDIILIP